MHSVPMEFSLECFAVYSVSIRNYKRCLYDASSYSYRDSNFKQLETAKETHPKGYTLLFFSWFFLLYTLSPIRELDWNHLIPQSACRKFFTDPFLDLSISICKFYAHQYHKRTWKYNNLFSDKYFWTLHTHYRSDCFIPQIGLNGYLWGLLASQLSVSILSILYLSCHLKKREFAT